MPNCRITVCSDCAFDIRWWNHGSKSRLSSTLSTGQRSLPTQLDDIRGFVQRRLANLRGLLYADVARARTALSNHLSEIRMEPVEGSTGKGHYVAKGQWDLLGEATDGLCVRVVAGDGFEPPTFGL